MAIDLFVPKNAAFKLSKDCLPDIKEAVKILKHVKVVTKILQNVDCTLSDLYGEFVKMTEIIKMLNNSPNEKTDLAKHLLKELNDRRDSLFKNESMLCSVYLNRKYALLLNIEQVEFAKKALYKSYKRAIRIMKLDKADEIVNVGDINSSIDMNFDMEAFLVEKVAKQHFMKAKMNHQLKT